MQKDKVQMIRWTVILGGIALATSLASIVEGFFKIDPEIQKYVMAIGGGMVGFSVGSYFKRGE